MSFISFGNRYYPNIQAIGYNNKNNNNNSKSIISLV